MGAVQPWHLLVIAVVGAFLFFGWKNLPDMSRSLGRSLRVFKTEIKGMTEDDKARESAREAASEPRQLDAAPAPRPAAERPAPRAEVVRNPAAPAARPAGDRPRPTPSPNGRAGSR